jgi:hypothetical protein
MSKKVADNLFRLIKSLTKAEKRYFKIYASRHTIGELNEYVHLFDLYEKQQVFEEKSLMKEFIRSGTPNKYSITKTRLFDTVLKSLEMYHANSSVEIELSRLLHTAEILFKKSLYDECLKAVVKAKKIAEQNEKYASLLAIARWEKKILEKDSYAVADEISIKELYDRDKKTMQHIENYNEYWNLKSLLFLHLNKHGKARDANQLDFFSKIISHPLLSDASMALSFDARYLYYQIKYTYYFALNDYENSYTYTLQMLRLLEGNAELIAKEPNRYFSVLSNMIYFCGRLKKQKELPMYLAKLRSLKEDLKENMTEDIELKLFSTLYSSELSVCLETGDYKKALTLIPEIEKGLKLYGSKINFMRESFFCFNCAIVFFAENDFRKSLKWLNRLLNNNELDSGLDLYCMARILNLIIHIELGNDELLPYAFTSTQRYLNKKNRTYKFETLMLNFIRVIMKTGDAAMQQKIYLELLTNLQDLTNDQFEKTVFEYFDFISWVESKLNHKSFASTTLEKITAA